MLQHTNILKLVNSSYRQCKQNLFVSIVFTNTYEVNIFLHMCMLISFTLNPVFDPNPNLFYHNELMRSSFKCF